jgi:uncharacterized membrane protein YdjX (TVP38/TMEM64 family)
MNRNTFLYAVGACIALFCIIWLINVVNLDVISLSVIKTYASSVLAFKEENYPLAVCAYIGLFIFLAACFIPVTIVMTVLGGYLFGGLYGGIYATVGATLGGGAVFLLVRYFFREPIRAKYEEQFRRFNKKFKHSASYLVCLQISPVTPTFFINVFTGLTHISLWTFIWTGFVGMLPGSLIYAYAGEKLHHIKSLDSIMSPRVFFVLLGISCLGIIIAFVSRDKSSHAQDR